MGAYTKFTRPIVVVSKCLCGAACRWDGDRLSNPLVRALKQYAKLIPVCPEIEIGLGVPRDRIVLVRRAGGAELYQPSTERRLAQKMNSFARGFLASHTDVDGFILKHKSPSCGLRKVKLFSSTAPDASFVRQGTGLFAEQVVAKHPHLAVADEDRLDNPRVREHWLTQLYTLAAFRAVRKSLAPGRLTAFHDYHRTLLSVHNKKLTDQLEKLAAACGAGVADCAEFEQYESGLVRILSRSVRPASVVKQYRQALADYSQYLSVNDRRRFEVQLAEYRTGKVSLAAVRKTVQIWAVRYDKSFTRDHALFRPYPGILADV